VAPGPGYLAIEIAKRGDSRVTGLDISETFVRIAQTNARAENVDVDFQHGNASAIPFSDASFDFIVCRAAFKNFTDPVGALDEMFRVLAPGGSRLDLRSA
jgi:ubiquinone/menaquinone biosynthesis C-methylase UbiE